MALKIAALDTFYKGRKFRSRLEARYAIVFDHLGIKWQYEPEGFNLGDGLLYLPDFWLPFTNDHCMEYENPGYYVEIKPVPPTEEEKEKARRLAKASHHHVHILYGDIDVADLWFVSGTGYEASYSGNEPLKYWNFHSLQHCVGGKGDVHKAVAAGLAARFEHGQTPK
jgi:hypothetical protein